MTAKGGPPRLAGSGPLRIGAAALVVAWVVGGAAFAAEGLVLRALHVADCFTKERLALQGGTGQRLRLPVFAFVVEHPTQGIVLVDTGFPAQSVGHPEWYPGRQSARLLNLRVDSAVAPRLADIGRAAGDVRVMTVTHLHSDHGGGILDFPEAELVVSESEWAALGSKRDKFGDAARAWRAHPKVRAVRFDDGPFGPFPTHEDVFGDGTVRLLPTHGHTTGHVAVLLRVEGRDILMGGDAAWIDRGWRELRPKSAVVRSLLEHDAKEAMGSLRSIATFAESNPAAAVFAAHEPTLLDRLPPWPRAWSWALWDSTAP